VSDPWFEDRMREARTYWFGESVRKAREPLRCRVFGHDWVIDPDPLAHGRVTDAVLVWLLGTRLPFRRLLWPKLLRLAIRRGLVESVELVER
jgi:hypothetical protein